MRGRGCAPGPQRPLRVRLVQRASQSSRWKRAASKRLACTSVVAAPGRSRRQLLHEKGRGDRGRRMHCVHHTHLVVARSERASPGQRPSGAGRDAPDAGIQAYTKARAQTLPARALCFVFGAKMQRQRVDPTPQGCRLESAPHEFASLSVVHSLAPKSTINSRTLQHRREVSSPSLDAKKLRLTCDFRRDFRDEK